MNIYVDRELQGGVDQWGNEVSTNKLLTRINNFYPLTGLGDWWEKNKGFRYGKEGEQLDTANVLKDLALGQTLQWETNKEGVVTVKVTDPLHGQGTEKKEDVVLEVDTVKLKQSSTILTVVLIVLGLIIGYKILD